VVTLYIAAATRDPAVFVYLEDVAPEGRVSYLTEGQLRLIHRKPADPATLPYDQGPAPHTYARADSLPVMPGEVMQVRFALFPAAALIRKGHRLRVAIAGADADTFHRYSEGKPESFEIHSGGSRSSGIELWMQP
jgi:putative CocE/NonD family hydrolase